MGTVRIVQHIIGLSAWLIVAMSLFGCGRKTQEDETPSQSSSPIGSLFNFASSVKSISGNQSEMAGWVIVFTERDTGISRVADIGPAGNYQIAGLVQSRAQTISLLDPTYRHTAVLSFPGAIQGTVRQYYKIAGKIMPALIHRGPILTFADMAGINVEPEAAADADFDGIPNGMELPAKLRVAGENPTDTDLDGIVNAKDSDIDGDGIINWFDNDDNSNLIPDIFDTDSDGNTIADGVEQTTDLYFKEIIDYLTVQIVQEVTDEKTLAMQTTLIFTTKVKSNITPKIVKIRGPDAALLASAQGSVVDPATGKSTLFTWDKTLADDGNNEDANAGDGVWSRKVVLDKTKSVKGGQVLFFGIEVVVNDPLSVLFEFPYTIPQVTSSAIKGSWDTKSKVLTMVGTPFEGIDRLFYTWSVHVFNKAGQKVYASEPTSAKTETLLLPVAEFSVKDDTYKAVLVAQSLDRIPGFPNWIIKSVPVDLK